MSAGVLHSITALKISNGTTVENHQRGKKRKGERNAGAPYPTLARFYFLKTLTKIHRIHSLPSPLTSPVAL